MSRRRLNPMKIMSILLAISLLLHGIPLIPCEKASAKKEEGNFYQEAVEFIRGNWEDDFFSTITLTVGSPIASVDGEEETITTVTKREGDVYVPVQEIAEIIGEDRNAKEAPPLAEDLCDVEEAADLLNLEAEVNGDTVSLYSPYQMKELVVQTKGNRSLTNDYGADQSVSDGNGLYLLHYASIEDTIKAHERFEADQAVDYVSANQVVHIGDKDAEVLEIGANATSVLSNRWGSERIHADLYKEYLSGNTNAVSIAVIDTGTYTEHPILAGRTVDGYDFINNKKNVTDDNGHGTHVSGTLADCTPEQVSIMPIKALDRRGYGDDMTIKLGIEYAVNQGARIINLSLGGECDDEDCLLKRAVEDAVEQGVCVVVAAGNEDDDTSKYCPARLDRVLTVAATDENDVRASFSNYGDAVDVCAPGVNITSSTLNGRYASMSGTSMATPFVSAAASMLLLDNIEMTPDELMDLVRETTLDLGEPAWDRYYGEGVVDLSLALACATEPTAIRLSPSEIRTELSQGQTMELALSTELEPVEAKEATVTYESSNPEVAEYSNGKVTVKGEGTAIITGTTTNGLTASCEVVASYKITDPAIGELPIQDEPIQDEPVQDEPIQDEPIQDEPVQDEPVQDEPIQDEPTQDEPTQDEPIQDEPIQDEPVQDEPVPEPVTFPEEEKVSNEGGDRMETEGGSVVADLLYQVKFDVKGGSAVASQTVSAAQTASPPSKPAKKGYVFLGWYRGGEPFDFSTKLTEDTTLYAKWKAYALSVNKKSVTLKKRKKRKLSVTSSNAKSLIQSIVWSSNRKKIATVTKKGLVRAVKQGKTNIIAKVRFKDGSKRRLVCKVRVK